MANERVADQGVLVAQAVSNQPPEAGDVCVVTAEGAPIDVPVLAHASDPEGDPLQVLTVSGPASGQVAIAPDGTLTFDSEQPGLQRFSYQVADGRGGSDTGEVTAFVNPVAAELDRPVLEGLSDRDLSEIAQACTGGVADEMVRLEGPEIRIADMAPGERIQVIAEPGQQIELQSRDFVRATYLVVDGGLLVVTPNGNLTYFSGFVDAAESGVPPTISVADGPAVASSRLLASLEPIAEPAVGEVVGRLPSPETGPVHWGGANFTPYDPGSIGPGLDPLGPLLPTALGLGIPPLLDTATPLLEDGDQGVGPLQPANQPPTFSADSTIERELGTITVSPQFASAGPFPTLAEKVRLADAQINGVDQSNLALGQSGDAAIVFNSEFSAFVSALGVFLIGPNGEILDPKIVFDQIEQAEPDPNSPSVRPGGGPVAAGDQVLLSELYGPDQLQPGQEFGLFLIANGFNQNQGDLAGELRFVSNGDTATILDPTPQLETADGRPIAGNVLFTADPTPGSPNDNPLNPDGLGHVVSGLLPDQSGLTIGFEDKLLSDNGDNDFNDVLVDIDLSPTVQAAFAGGAIQVAIDATVADPDDTSLRRASVELLNGQPGDALGFDGSLVDTGVTLVASTTSLVFEGAASIPDYVQILQGVVFEPVPVAGVRQIGFSVVDAQGAASNQFVVNADLSATGAEVGTAAEDMLSGQPLVDDAISGLDGDDVLFGDSGDDLLDGGTGNDILDGGDGDDQLIGGPGVDLLTGGPGADSQIYFSLADRGDRIFGFNADEGDTLDFSELLQGATASTIDDFVQFASVGGDVAVGVDVDGSATSFGSVPFLTLVDPTGVTTAQEAVDNGSLVV